MRAKSKTLVLSGCLIAAFASCAWLVSSMPRGESSANAAVALLASSQQVSRSDVESALFRVGLDADALTAAGVTNANQVTGVVNAVRNQLVTSMTTVSAIESISGTARQAVDALEHRVQSGTGNEQDVTALAEARATLNTVSGQKELFLNGLFNAGVFLLSGEQQSALSTSRANRANWTMPTEYLTTNRSEPAWVALRAALASERIALQRGEELHPTVVAHLAEVRGEASVASAITNLASHLSATRQAWAAALSSIG